MKKILKTKVFVYITLILFGVASWAFWALLNQAIGDLLLKFGIENIYTQYSLIIIIIIILLVLFGYGVSKSIDKILGK